MTPARRPRTVERKGAPHHETEIGSACITTSEEDHARTDGDHGRARRRAGCALACADDSRRGRHLTTGEIGLRALLDSLGDAGRADVVLEMAKNDRAELRAHGEQRRDDAVGVLEDLVPLP